MRVTSPRSKYESVVVRSLGRDEATRVLGQYLSCRGIHLPKDPSPRTLPPDVRGVWERVRKNALKYEDKKTAAKTAWKTLRLFYRNLDTKTPVLAPSLPRPGMGPVSFLGTTGDLATLGVCVEYSYIDGDGSLRRWTFEADAPPLYWSEDTKSLYIFPYADRSNCQTPDPKSVAAQMSKRWTQRPAVCARTFVTPQVDVQLVGNASTLVYRSDKWHPRNPDDQQVGDQEYIHQLGDGVGVWQSATPQADSGPAPEAVVLTGGCLDAEERGIIH